MQESFLESKPYNAAFPPKTRHSASGVQTNSLVFYTGPQDLPANPLLSLALTFSASLLYLPRSASCIPFSALLSDI